MMKKSRSNAKKNTLLLCVSILFAMVLSEIIVRLFNLSPTVSEIQLGHYRLSENPLVRFELKKNAPYVHKDFQNFFTNSFGFVERDWTVPKEEDVTRIAVLGDSVTMAISVPYGQRYTDLLQNQLNQAFPATTHEVLNLGVGGYNFLQEIALFEEKYELIRPDMVIYGYCLNDANPVADGGVYQGLLDQMDREATSWLSSQRKGLQNRMMRALLRSHLFKLIYFHYTTSLKSGKSDPIMLRGSSYILETGFTILSTLKKRHGFKACIVIFPAFRDFSDYKYGSLHRLLIEKSTQYGIEVFDLLQAFQKKSKEDGRDFRSTPEDYCHMNALGHQVAADAIFKNVFLKEHSP